MRSIVILMLISLAFAGCTDDAPDEHTDECADAADHDACHEAQEHMEEGEATETMKEPVVISISWDGIYRVNGAYSTDTITVPANSTVELTFTNNDQIGHDFVVEGIEGAATNVIDNGESETIIFEVGGPESLKFFCSVPGHRGNGMEGDFIIE